MPTFVVISKHTFDESKHPRASDGKFGSGAGGSSGGSSPATVGGTVKVDGAKYTVEPVDGDDTFPPAIASYEIKDGHVLYRGRNGSEGVIGGTPDEIAGWMRDVAQHVKLNPPEGQQHRPYNESDGGAGNVAKVHAAVDAASAAFGIPKPKVELTVAANPLEAGEHSSDQISVANPHLATNAALNFKPADGTTQAAHTAAHEVMHGVYSANPDAGKRAMSKLAASGEYVSPYHALGGHFEGLMDLGAAYVHSPEQLKQHSPKLYEIAQTWKSEVRGGKAA